MLGAGAEAKLTTCYQGVGSQPTEESTGNVVKQAFSFTFHGGAFQIWSQKIYLLRMNTFPSVKLSLARTGTAAAVPIAAAEADRKWKYWLTRKQDSEAAFKNCWLLRELLSITVSLKEAFDQKDVPHHKNTAGSTQNFSR